MQSGAADTDAADSAEDDVPAPTLLMGMLTAVATGSFVGWALLPASTTVAGLPLFAVVAVATTLWAGIGFLYRELPTGVLADGFYLMALAVLVRPAAEFVAAGGTVGSALGAEAGLGVVFIRALVGSVVAAALAAVGWRLDSRARKIRLRRARRKLKRGVPGRVPGDRSPDDDAVTGRSRP